MLIKNLLLLLVFVLTKTRFILDGRKGSFALFKNWDENAYENLMFDFYTSQKHALLLYQQENEGCKFLELKLSNGFLQLRFNFGYGDGVLLIENSTVHRNTWHTVNIKKPAKRIILSLDTSSVEIFCNNSTSRIGGKKHNSGLFFGGLPSWFAQNIKSLIVPSVTLEPEFYGKFKNFIYFNNQKRIRHQSLIAYKGVSFKNVDFCTNFTCKNGGICYFENKENFCDCSKTDFTGKNCEKENEEKHIHFDGEQNIVLNTSKFNGKPLMFKKDSFSLMLKTKNNGIIYQNGNSYEKLKLLIKNGYIHLSLKSKEETANEMLKTTKTRIDDDKWHFVNLSRILKQDKSNITLLIILSIDKKPVLVLETKTSKCYLFSNEIIVGKLEKEDGFFGCAKKIIYETETFSVSFLKELMFGNPIFEKKKFLSNICKTMEVPSVLPVKQLSLQKDDNDVTSDEISITNKDSFLILPAVTLIDSEISFEFKTEENVGILFLALDQINNKYLAAEIHKKDILIHIKTDHQITKEILMKSNISNEFKKTWQKLQLKIRKNELQIELNDLKKSIQISDYEKFEIIGPIYLGGINLFDRTTHIASNLTSFALKHGFIGCLRFLTFNKNHISLTDLAIKQNSGSIRFSCEKTYNTCNTRPCKNGGNCINKLNGYICDCSSTSFTGPTCSRGSHTISLQEKKYLAINFTNNTIENVVKLSLRFRTSSFTGIVFSGLFKEKKSIVGKLNNGKLEIIYNDMQIIILGHSLNDDLWHTLRFVKENNILTGIIDDDDPVKYQYTTDFYLKFSSFILGSNERGITGRIQQLLFNDEDILEKAFYQHYFSEGDVKFQQIDDETYNSVSFMSQHTYVGLPQLKVYGIIDIFFKFKSTEENGLILYNEGKKEEFLAVELLNGHIQYSVNMGYGPKTLQDSSKQSLADNKLHTVRFLRLTKFSLVLIVDNYQKLLKNKLGENYFLNLDGILYLGGVKKDMYKILPSAIKSKIGFQGCFSNFEVNNEAIDPNKDALIRSLQVSQECQDSVALEFFYGGNGLVTYQYPDEKQPDTKFDSLTIVFLTTNDNSVLMRVDSGKSNDYLEIKLVDGFLKVEYNLGTENIVLMDQKNVLNDGKYHIIRFERTGQNATLRLDSNEKIMKTPDGRHLTVFSSQNIIQIGSIQLDSGKKKYKPFHGIIANLVYNGINLIDNVLKKKKRTKVKGLVKIINKLPTKYRDPIKKSNLPLPAKITQTIFSEEKVLTNCDDDDLCEGSGEKNQEGKSYKKEYNGIGRGVFFAGGGFMPCDDDEDICDFGSGGSESSMFSPEHDISINISSTTSFTTNNLDSTYSTERTNIVKKEVWSVFKDEDITQKSEICYDHKHNVVCDEVTRIPTEPPKKDIRSMSGTMSLVIGIILGSFIAMILIVIIVLKVRTGVEVNDTKQDDMKRYQFCSPTIYEKDDFSIDTGTTSLINGKNSNGIFNGNFSSALGGDRAKLFKKANNYGKPVREWYV